MMRRATPQAFTLIPGKDAKDVFGPSSLDFDPFEGAPLPKDGAVNPRAKKVGSGK